MCRVTHLAVTKKLIPVRLGEWLAAKVLAVDGIDPHVAIAWVDHGAHHAETMVLAFKLCFAWGGLATYW